jgi:hypothetical protein
LCKSLQIGDIITGICYEKNSLWTHYFINMIITINSKYSPLVNSEIPKYVGKKMKID